MDSIVQLFVINPTSTPAEERDSNFCPYPRRKGHPLDQCFDFRKISDKKLQDGEIILQDAGTWIVHNDLSLITTTKGKSDLGKMAERGQHLHKFKHFYDQMDFNTEQRLASTKSIELIEPTEPVAWSRGGSDA